jgi:hypothetical protein
MYLNTSPCGREKFNQYLLDCGCSGEGRGYSGEVWVVSEFRLVGLGWCTVVSNQINPYWDCLQANYMSSSFKTDNMICSF